VVQRGGLCSPSRTGVVVTRNGVQELRARVGVEPIRTSFDQPETEVNMAEKPTLIGLPERRPRGELCGASDVVEKGGG
jgi:hypothetical protein